MTPVNPENETWILHVDGSSNPNGSGASIMLESPDGVVIEVSLTFSFQTSNNQVEYKACIVRLHLAIDLRVPRVSLQTNSLLVVSQISDKYETKEPTLQKYLSRVCELLAKFEKTEVKHVPRAKNQRAYIPSKLTSTKTPGNYKRVIQEIFCKPSIPLDLEFASTVCVIEES